MAVKGLSRARRNCYYFFSTCLSGLSEKQAVAFPSRNQRQPPEGQPEAWGMARSAQDMDRLPGPQLFKPQLPPLPWIDLPIAAASHPESEAERHDLTEGRRAEPRTYVDDLVCEAFKPSSTSSAPGDKSSGKQCGVVGPTWAWHADRPDFKFKLCQLSVVVLGKVMQPHFAHCKKATSISSQSCHGTS